MLISVTVIIANENTGHAPPFLEEKFLSVIFLLLTKKRKEILLSLCTK